jgi:hypothetical protein
VTPKSRHELLVVLSIILTAWVVLSFFEGAYFASFFYNVPTPWWAAWVGSFPNWWLNVVDTIMAVVLITAIVLSIHHGRRRRTVHSARAGGAGWAWFVVGLIILGAALGYVGLTLTGLMSSFLRFVGLGH